VVAAAAQITDATMTLLQILQRADGLPSGVDGQGYVKHYDPSGNEGRGDLVLTRHRGQAKRYPSKAAAMDEWKRVSATHPTRPDGKPNRPLSAFSVAIVDEELDGFEFGGS
jgi:hypothetical protein